MKSSKRWFWFGWCGLIFLGLLVLSTAPLSNTHTQGSSFSRSPDGYGAWYAYMQKQGVSIQRWQRPPTALWQSNPEEPITLLRVLPPGEGPSDSAWRDWVAQGNTLIVLGVPQPATEAAFSSQLPSEYGTVYLDTRRRQVANTGEETLLGDRYGAVVWQQSIDMGVLIAASTSHLAANAYQEAPGNFAFLAALVTHANQAIWVDEYLHGYESLTPEDEKAAGIFSPTNWSMYLAQTPWLLVVVQAIAIVLVLLWGLQRLGTPQAIANPPSDNSEAYITALAGVLRQANSTGFVIEMVAKAERLRLQKHLGLGTSPVADQLIVDAWVQQTRLSPHDLVHWLQMSKRRSPLSAKDLTHWLQTIQSIQSDENLTKSH